MEAPGLESTYLKYKDRGFETITIISSSETNFEGPGTLENVQAWAEELNLTHTVMTGDKAATDSFWPDNGGAFPAVKLLAPKMIVESEGPRPTSSSVLESILPN